MLKPFLAVLALALLLGDPLSTAPPTTSGLLPTPRQDDVLIDVLDIGPGLSCVVTMPGDEEQDHRYLIYDAGHWSGGGRPTFDAIAERIPEDSEIELLVLSHSDSDHLAAVDEICDAYTVKRVLRTGYPRTTATWRDADAAIRLEVELEDCEDYNLSEIELLPGACFRFGDVFVQFVCGFDQPLPEWGSLSTSKRRNSISICVRLFYAGHSVLFAGDAVGREDGTAGETPAIATERFMVDNAPVIFLDSDVLIAPHHGADNACSLEFLRAVSPDWIVFSAGHDHEHPRRTTAERCLGLGLAPDRLLRTDRGDDEGGEEWPEGAQADSRDPTGDDDIRIVLPKEGQLRAGYRN